MTDLSRRHLLKGLGAVVALPWLESLAGAAAAPAKKAAPKRFACLFIGDGISPSQWWAKGTGADMELGPSLAPLAAFKEKINVIDGLFNREGDGGHARCTGNILSGSRLQRGRTIKGGVSMDQLLAKKNEEETALPSLVLGCEQPVSGFHESQYSMVYASHISWRNPDSPIPIELHPSLAFDSLFGSKAGKLTANGEVIPYPNLIGGVLGFLYGHTYSGLDVILQQLWDENVAKSGRVASDAASRLAQSATAIADAPYQAPQARTSTVRDAFSGVACSDTRNPENRADWWRAGVAQDKQYPWFGSLWTWASATCAKWPIVTKSDSYFGPFGGPTANPILVVGNTYDPATPIHGARKVASLFEKSRLLTYDGWGHGALGNSCVTAAFDRYYATSALPAVGATCTMDAPLFSAS